MRRSWWKLFAPCGLVIATHVATASPAAQPTTAREVAGKPLPGQARNQIAEEPARASTGTKVARVALLVPRGLSYVVLEPVRGIAYLDDRYKVYWRLEDLFTNDTRTFGVYPIALAETSFGINAGARLFWNDISSRGESLHGRVSFGGRYSQIYTLDLDSGHRFRAVRGHLTGAISLRDRDQFFGIGNGDEVSSTAMPIDALTSTAAVHSRFRQNVERVQTNWTTVLLPRTLFALGGAYEHRTFYTSHVDVRNDVNVAEAYQLGSLIGFNTGLDTLTGYAVLRYDSRSANWPYLIRPEYTHGGVAGVFGAYNYGLGDDPSNYGRTGFDLQYLLNLYAHTRVLVFRLYGEGVIGSLDNIPFVSLTRLGGSELLRGYDSDRFRDRLAGLGSVQYRWQLHQRLSAYLFADTGRVYRDLGDLTFSGLRLGYGGGLELGSGSGFVARAQLASSIDGGLFFSLMLDDLYSQVSPVGHY